MVDRAPQCPEGEDAVEVPSSGAASERLARELPLGGRPSVGRLCTANAHTLLLLDSAFDAPIGAGLNRTEWAVTVAPGEEQARFYGVRCEPEVGVPAALSRAIATTQTTTPTTTRTSTPTTSPA